MVQIINPPSTLVPLLKGVHLFGFDGAPCSQRVCFALAEKGLLRSRSVAWKSFAAKDCQSPPGSYTFRPVSLIRKEHLDPEYAAIQPNLVVPALVHDGQLHIESMDIIAYLDETWPANPLLPASSCELLRARIVRNTGLARQDTACQCSLCLLPLGSARSWQTQRT